MYRMKCAISDTLCPNSTMQENRQSQDRVTFYREDEETPDINHPKSDCCKTQRDGYPKLGRPSTLLFWHHFADIWSDFMEGGTGKQGSKNSISVWAHLHCHSLGSSVYRRHPWHLLLEHNTLFQTQPSARWLLSQKHDGVLWLQVHWRMEQHRGFSFCSSTKQDTRKISYGKLVQCSCTGEFKKN